MGYTITIDTDKCTGDGECVDVCPVEVYELQDGKAVAVNEDECLGCESCVEVCENRRHHCRRELVSYDSIRLRERRDIRRSRSI